MDVPTSSDTEDEVFFGPILAKEAKKASKLRRTTEVFLPNFRLNQKRSSSRSSCCEQEDTDSLSDEVFEAPEAGHLKAGCNGQLSQSNTEVASKAENVSKQALGSLASPHQVFKDIKEAGPSHATPSSPFPKIVELSKSKCNDIEQEESPFQRKSKALLDLIHRAREEWSSPTHSPLSVGLLDSGSGSLTKRKHISSCANNPSSPVLNKVAKVTADSDPVQSKEDRGGAKCNPERETKSQSPPQATGDDVSYFQTNSLDVQKVESCQKEECSKNLCKELTEAERMLSDDTEGVQNEEKEEDTEDKNSKCLTPKMIASTDTDEVLEADNVDTTSAQINGGLSSSRQSEGCDDVSDSTKSSAFSPIAMESRSNTFHTSCKPLVNVSCQRGYTDFGDVADLASQQSTSCLHEKLCFRNKENIAEKSEPPKPVPHNHEDTFFNDNTKKKNSDMHIQKSTSVQNFHEHSNLYGFQGYQGDQLISSAFGNSLAPTAASGNPQHSLENMNMHHRSPFPSTCAQVAVIQGGNPGMSRMTTPQQVESPMSLQRKLEEKRAQLMKLKQAKDEMKRQILQGEKQFYKKMENALALQSNDSSFEAIRPKVGAVSQSEALPTETLDETSFDELTRFYTWRNSQFLSKENYPPNSPECLHQGNQDKPRLRWTDNLVVEVTELSSPSRPAPKGKSILSKKM